MIEWIISSSILICIIAGIRFLFHGKIRPTVQYLLWGLVLVRLLFPFSLGSTRYSVANIAPAAVSQQTAPPEPGHISFGEGSHADHAVLPDLPAAEKAPAASSAAETGKWVVKAVWIGGMLTAGIIWGLSNTFLHVRLKHSRRKIGRNGSVPIYQTNILASPCLFGMIKPSIYVTDEVMENKKFLRHSIVHESMHFHHLDHVWTVLRCICLVIHWYNPLVWWAASLSRRDAELACDEAVVHYLGEQERMDYGKTLIRMTCVKSESLLNAAATMSAGKKGVKERIMMIARKPKTAFLAMAMVLTISAAAVGCTFTGSKHAEVPASEAAETLPGMTISSADTQSAVSSETVPLPSESTRPADHKGNSAASPADTQPAAEAVQTAPDVTEAVPSSPAEENTDPVINEATNETAAEATAESFPGVPSEFLDVLTGKKSFYDSDSQAEMSLPEFYASFEQISGLNFSVGKYALADLDRNGTQELILWLGNDSMDYGTEVFTIHGQDVWGYTLSYRQFMDLKSDGTFSYSGGAANSGIASLTFEKEGCHYNDIAGMTMSDDEAGTISYSVGGEEVTEEEYLSFVSRQEEKDVVTWYLKQ